MADPSSLNDLLLQHPELLGRMMSLAGQEQQDADLQEQLAQAEALRQAGPQRIGAVPGALQAGADILNAWTSKRRSEQVRKDRTALWDKMAGVRGGIAEDLAGIPSQPLKPDPYGES